jgi:DNA polymerase I-like protein with 3'-5' exonuclease and polymerase domains
MSLFDKSKQIDKVCDCPVFKLTYGDLYYNFRSGNSDESDVLILREAKPYNDSIESSMDSHYKKLEEGSSVSVLYALNCTPNEIKSSQGFSTATVLNCSTKHTHEKIQKIAPKVIVAEGRSLMFLTRGGDLITSNFYSIHPDDRWFWSPDYNCRVYPMPAVKSMYHIGVSKSGSIFHSLKNSYEIKFFNQQINHIRKYIKTYTRSRKIKLELIEPNDYKKFIEDSISNGKEWVAIDIETDGFDYWRGRILSIQFAFDEYSGYFLDWCKIVEHNLINLLNTLLSSKKQIGHNYKFDVKWLRRNGITSAKCDFDTQLASHSVNENMRKGLKALAWVHTKYGGYEYELKSYQKVLDSRDFSKLPKDILLKYSVTDSIITYQLFVYFKKRLDGEDAGVRDNFYNVVMAANEMLIDLEMSGIQINESWLFHYNKRLNQLKSVLENRMRSYSDSGDFKFSSAKQLSDIIRKHPKFSVLRDGRGNALESKTGYLILDKKAVPQYAEMGIEICQYLVKYNSVIGKINKLGVDKAMSIHSKNQSNLGDSLFSDITGSNVNTDLNYLSDIAQDGLVGTIYDGRVYGNFDLDGTDSGRFSSSGGLKGKVNLQNPEKSKAYRRIFIPKEGFVFMEIDFSSMEVRQISQVSGPGVLEKVILDGLDIHSMTGVSIYNLFEAEKLNYEEFDRRRLDGDPLTNYYRNKKAKPVNFSCFAGETLVKTNRGDLRIDAIVANKNIGWEETQDKNLLFLQRDGSYSNCSHSVYNEVEEVLDFEMEDGSMFTVTPDHIVIVIRDGIELKIEAKDVLGSDGILTQTNTLILKSISKRTGKFKVYCVSIPGRNELVLANNNIVIGNCQYGGTEHAISNSLKINKEDALKILRSYYDTYHEFAKYIEDSRAFAIENGYVQSLLGKKRRLPELTYGVHTDNNISNELNVAINFPIQSLSGQTTIIAMTHIHRRLKENNLKTRMIANVHDSILFELLPEEKDVVAKIAEEEMCKPRYTNNGGNKVTLAVETTISSVWGFRD